MKIIFCGNMDASEYKESINSLLILKSKDYTGVNEIIADTQNNVII